MNEYESTKYSMDWAAGYIDTAMTETWKLMEAEEVPNKRQLLLYAFFNLERAKESVEKAVQELTNAEQIP